MPLADVGQFVQDVEVEDSGLAGLQVSMPEVHPPPLVVDVGVGVFGDQIHARLGQDLLPQPVVEKRDEVRVPIQAGEHGRERLRAYPQPAVDPDASHA